MSYQVVYQIVRGVYYFLYILEIAVFVYALMSWFVKPYNRFYVFLRNLVSPILAPFRPLSRKLMERGFMLDLSVLFAILALRLLQSLLPRLIFRLFGY